MDWINSNWQSLAAGAVVAVTAAVFVVRVIRRKPLRPPCASCGGNRGTSGGGKRRCS